MLFLREQFGGLALDVQEVPLSDSIKSDADYSTPVKDISYEGRFNLRLVRPGSGEGKTLLLNAHTDVVPPSEGMTDAWSPRVENALVFGRGACDDKGQIATIYLVLKALESLNVKLSGDVITHLVVEEENGGNGSLAMVRRGENADACIVMEASNNKVFTSIRGAVWFHLELIGKAGHSGQATQTRSALLMARDAIAILEQFHAHLLAESRGDPLFDKHENPMPLTFGRLSAGNWPASAPNKAVLEGVLGLLPNKTAEQVCRQMRQALVEASDAFLAEHFDLSFMYRHDSSVLSQAHKLPQGLLKAAQQAGTNLQIDAMTASCDAWFYNNQLQIPTVVYGPGTLKVAHSKDEHIALADIAQAAEVLIHFMLDYNEVH